jgi:hypothetical protein
MANPMLSAGHVGLIDTMHYGQTRNDATLAAALADLGATPHTLLLLPMTGDGVWTLNATHSFPATMRAVLAAGVTIQGSGALTFGRTPLALGTEDWYQGTGVLTFGDPFGGAVSLGDPRYGAVGDGVTDDSAAVQAACDEAVARGVTLEVPVPAVGYRINTPINLTDLDGPLTIRGQGMRAPTFGLAFVSPVHTSVFLGNTGTGKCVFDCLGSNNLVLRDLSISTLGMPTPSTVGILFGTSTTSPTAPGLGGSNCNLVSVAIYMQNANNACPVYYVGGTGVCHWMNVWTLGVYGFLFSANNVLGFSSTHATIGTAAGIDGMCVEGCSLLGYGGAPVLTIENCHNMRFVQLYTATIFGGPAYLGQRFPLSIINAVDIKIDVESDYWPSLVYTQGSINKLVIEGTIFPNETPLAPADPLVGFFDGTTVANSRFLVTGLVSPKTNYWYTSSAAVPVLTSVRSCQFLFDTTISPNVFFGVATGGAAVPFFNLTFDGNSDAAAVTLTMNGIAATNAQKRYRVNGVLFGTG